MKPKRSRKSQKTTTIEGNWIDMDDLVKEGESKEIWEGVWVAKGTWTILDPPEPIKKSRKSRRPKK